MCVSLSTCHFIKANKLNLFHEEWRALQRDGFDDGLPHSLARRPPLWQDALAKQKLFDFPFDARHIFVFESPKLRVPRTVAGREDVFPKVNRRVGIRSFLLARRNWDDVVAVLELPQLEGHSDLQEKVVDSGLAVHALHVVEGFFRHNGHNATARQHGWHKRLPNETKHKKINCLQTHMSPTFVAQQTTAKTQLKKPICLRQYLFPVDALNTHTRLHPDLEPFFR